MWSLYFPGEFEQVFPSAEGDRPGRACFGAGRQFPLLDQPVTEDAFDDLGLQRAFVVIGPHVARARDHAVPAAEAEGLGIDDRALRRLCVCMDGAAPGAGALPAK